VAADVPPLRDLFLAPTEFVRAKLIAAGFPRPTDQSVASLSVSTSREHADRGKGIHLYFGRLHQKKAWMNFCML